jgi:putative flippase GtrA
MEIHRQFFRYAVVGVASNVALYFIYLLMTGIGMGHKTAMTLVYCVGVLQTYIVNRRWTFLYRGEISGSMLRYVAAYASGYVFNFVALLVLVDMSGLPHRVVQAVLILAVAVLIFLLQKYWVFREATEMNAAVGRKQS